MIEKTKRAPSTLRLLGIIKNDVFIGPEKLQIDINSSCNLNCIYCWYHSKFRKNKFDKNHEFPYEIFKKLIDSCAEWGLKSVVLSGQGEPFLHSKITNMIKYVKKKKLNLTIVTNATFSENCLRYLTYIDNLLITLSAGSQKMYEKVQDTNQNGYFDAVTRNLSFINKLRERGLKTPGIVMNFIINEVNHSDLENLFILANKFHASAVRLVIMHYEEPNFKKIILSEKSVIKFKKMLRNLLKNKKLTGNISHNIREIYNIFSDKDFLNSKQRMVFYQGKAKIRKCYLSWYQAYVNLDGDVMPCCKRSDIVVGNIFNSEFIDLWKSDKFARIRRNFKNNLNLNDGLGRNCRLCYLSELNQTTEKRVKRLESLQKL